jgi:hypothetical protein
MASDTQAERTVAEAIRNTLQTACHEGDPHALVPELVTLLTQRPGA